jgi:hypothetical protein
MLKLLIVIVLALAAAVPVSFIYYRILLALDSLLKRAKASVPSVIALHTDHNQIVQMWQQFPDASSFLPPPIATEVATGVTGVWGALAPDVFGIASGVSLESPVLANSGFAVSARVMSLYIDKLAASREAMMEPLTLRTEMSTILGRPTPVAQRALPPGRPMWYVGYSESFPSLRVGRRNMMTSPVAIKVRFGTGRICGAPTIGVPQRSFAPELPEFVPNMFHSQA